FDVVGVGNAAATATTTITYSGTAQAEAAYTLVTRLHGSSVARDLLPGSAPRAGQPGTITLTIGAGFAGLNSAPASGHPAVAGSRQGGTPAQPAVQTRNAAASICAGLPAANRNPGTPP
ncbi:MAG TPA: hypothetical protein VGS19_24230, partial [Streptosporangiaceae bacterium]|nr:hypothetical protein [Streptosporangiaceae bacterium]